MKKGAIIISGIIFFWILIHTLIITIDGLKDNIEVCDAAVVLGNKVELDGNPSKGLKGRLDRAVELYEKKYFNYVIVSGGVGKEGFDEAEVMKDYLIKRGIPEDNVITDNNGYNTFMTAQNSKIIMDKRDFDSVMVISQFFHITRTKLAFKKVGFDRVYSAHAKFFGIRDVYSLVREFFAYYKYLFL